MLPKRELCGTAEGNNSPWIVPHRESAADTPGGNGRTRYVETELDHSFDDPEDQPPRRLKRKPFFSFLSGNPPRGLPALDNELFSEAKSSQSRPNWPSFFDVPEDHAPRDHAALRASILGSVPHHVADTEGRKFYQGGKQSTTVLKKRPEKPEARIIEHIQDIDKRRMFILTLAKCLLTFGSPSHRIDVLLFKVARVLDAKAAFVHIPDVVIVTFGDEDVASVETRFVKAKGQIALSPLYDVHTVYRKVLHDTMTVEDGTRELTKLLDAPAVYSIWPRCLCAFVLASMMSAMAFGGSIIDMWISGLCSFVLQYLGVNAAAKSSTYANVYEISVSIIVSFVSRALSTISTDLFCFNAICAAGVVLILPGFTILLSALELTSHNILCGSVRMVYAIIYTLFLGFGLAIGSDIFLVISPKARHIVEKSQTPTYKMLHGHFEAKNGTFSLGGAVFGFARVAVPDKNYLLRGCHRDPSWPWWRQPLPWWLLPVLVPTYCIASSLSNMQRFRSPQLIVMVIFACIALTANKVGNIFLPDNGDVVSAFGALVIGLLGNCYSRIVRGTAFTSMVTGVIILVPFGIAEGGGLIDPSSSEQYSTGFNLAIRMIRVAIGITLGLFVSQIFVYAFGRRQNAAYMPAF